MIGTRRFLRQVGILARKDLEIFFLDPGSVAFALLFPFVGASASRESIVAAKMAGSFLRGMVQVAVFWIAGILVLQSGWAITRGPSC